MMYQGEAIVEMGLETNPDIKGLIPLHSFHCSWKRIPHGMQVPNAENLCMIDFCTDGNKSVEIAADTKCQVITYEEIINEAI